MSQQANKRRSERIFDIGDYVYLKLHLYRQISVRGTAFHKLLHKFYGPYKVLDKIGSAAYKIELPAASGTHNVFHVSQLKLYRNPNTAPAHANATTDVPSHGQLEPEKILDRKMVKRGRVAATKVLVSVEKQPSRPCYLGILL